NSLGERFMEDKKELKEILRRTNLSLGKYYRYWTRGGICYLLDCLFFFYISSRIYTIAYCLNSRSPFAKTSVILYYKIFINVPSFPIWIICIFWMIRTFE